MELREYLRTVKKNLVFIVILAIFGGLTALVLTSSLTEGVRVQQHFFVVAPKEGKSLGSSFQYGGFYSQEVARNFTDTAVAILETPEFTSGFLDDKSSFAVRKVAPQVIRVTVASSDTTAANKILEKTILGFNRKIIDLTGSDQVIQVKPIGKSSQTLAPTLDRKITTLFGMFVGATFALFVVSLKLYLRL